MDMKTLKTLLAATGTNVKTLGVFGVLRKSIPLLIIYIVLKFLFKIDLIAVIKKYGASIAGVFKGIVDKVKS